MRLKTISLNGYKTFASKTHFEFGAGITAVIGPNGSGKSNVADAIRWALGEQQFSLMRSKRTDDMIFAGSPKRPRASMAEVVLTFDNSDGFFPIGYQEIAIGRRAYRDGSNEYLLNGSRVRLREIGDLLSHSGLAERTYTVIGQGSVDTALAQKPEERRALFEEAAGIGGYRDRREDALRKLTETHHNLERVKDILAEITPRLAQLERQAARARQYQVLAAELDGHLRIWFGHHYHVARKAIQTAQALREERGKEVAQWRESVARLDAGAAHIREEQTALRTQLAEVLPQRDAARRHSEDSARNLAVLRERVIGFDAQVLSARNDAEQRKAGLEALSVRATHAAALLIGAERHLSDCKRDLAEKQKAADIRQAARSQTEGERNAAQKILMAVNSELAALRNEINSLQTRNTNLRQKINATTQRIEQMANQRERELQGLTQVDTQIEQDSARGQEFETQVHAAQQRLENARATLTLAQSNYAAAEAEEKLTKRMSLFAEMRAQQTANELVSNALKTNISGVLGTLASLIQVLPDEQRAVTSVLGEALNSLVVESPDSLNQVRRWLATVQSTNTKGEPNKLRLMPLDMVIRRAHDNPMLFAASDDPSYEYMIESIEMMATRRARAAQARPMIEVIGAPDWLRPALPGLVGHAFICRNWAQAQALAAELPRGCVCVTREGEIAYATGEIALNAGVPQKPINSEEAEAMDAAILELSPEEAKTRRVAASAARDTAQREVDVARRAVDDAVRARDGFGRESSQRRNNRADAGRRIERLEENLAALAGEIEQNEQEVEQLTKRVDELRTTGGERERHQAEVTAQVTALDAELKEQLSGGWMEALNAAHAAVASGSEAVRSADAMRRDRLQGYATAVQQIADTEQRVAHLLEQQTASQVQLKQFEQTVAEAEAQLREVDATLLPIQQAIAAIDSRIAEADTHKREAERGMLDAEQRFNLAELEVAKHQNEIENLRERAADAFQSATVSQAEESEAIVGAQLSLDGLDQAISLLDTLEVVEELPEGTNEKITQLRNQIKRLGAINYEAQAEFDELQQRAKFLTEQSEDLEKASATLQQVIAELNDVMKATFQSTFEAIAAHFQNTFRILFGGGQAKLTLTNPDNIDECGVEITAQPPGKRAQNLSLLSGGERSLTATALIFAILRVKPTPFCVLDEVDAALDESNVGRIRNMLETLVDSTQFIVVTHNRGTVEAANTIYGISMGPDGASQVLSLRLDDVSTDNLGERKEVDPASVRSGAGWVPPNAAVVTQ